MTGAAKRRPPWPDGRESRGVRRRLVQLLAARPGIGAPALRKLLETGIKVIDVMCPLVAGGTLAIEGNSDWGRWCSWRNWFAG